MNILKLLKKLTALLSCCKLFELSIYKHVPEYVRKYATEEALRSGENVSSDSESSMSDFSENEAEDMEL